MKYKKKKKKKTIVSVSNRGDQSYNNWNQWLRYAMTVIFTFPLLLLLVFFATFNGISAAACEPYYCGDMNISYPFWVKGSGDEYCGYPGFELWCENNKSVLLHLVTEVYNVTDIDYEAKTLSLVDTDLTQSDCPRPRHNVVFNASSFLSYSTSILNLTFLFNCSDSIVTSLAYYNHDSLSCLGSRTLFSYVVEGLIPGLNFNGFCNESVVVPVLESALDDGNITTAGFGEVLKKGFRLVWTPAGSCSLCEADGGSCGENTVTHSFVCYQNGRKSTTRLKVIIALSAASGTLMLAGLLLVVCLRMSKLKIIIPVWKNSKRSRDFENFIENHRTQMPERYSYSDIRKMTNYLKSKLGEGGFGSVFRGQVLDGRPVAVKILSDSKGKGEDFINEVAAISRTSHVNIVRLVGFCFQGSHRALVYEFMANGSLEKFIFDKNPKHGPLGWEKLFQIALGIARGLEYLHRGCNMRILHFDIKPHNILLDQDFCPKISDFGLAKLCPDKESIVSMTTVRGTMGYIAPEVMYRKLGGVSQKSDVYSYGMLLLEMVGGRKNIDAGVENTSEIYFPDWIYNRINKPGDLLLDEVMEETYDELARKLIMVGLWCIQTKPMDRPTMSKVVEMLEGNLQVLQMPPKPFLYSLSEAE